MPRLKNPKHEKFVKGFLKGQRATDAYQDVYPYSKRTTANNQSSVLMKRDDIQQRITELLNKDGGTIEDVVQATVDDLKATKEVLTSKGKKVHLKDNATRQGAQKLLYTLHQAPGFSKTQETNITKNTVNLNVSADQIASLGKLVEKLEKASDKMLGKDIIQDGEIVE